jgi:hypothetical protein
MLKSPRQLMPVAIQTLDVRPTKLKPLVNTIRIIQNFDQRVTA